MTIEKCKKKKCCDAHPFVEAAKLKCESEVLNAIATIDMYSRKYVGVADHADIMDEIYKAAKQGAEARDVLKFLNSI